MTSVAPAGVLRGSAIDGPPDRTLETAFRCTGAGEQVDEPRIGAHHIDDCEHDDQKEEHPEDTVSVEA